MKCRTRDIQQNARVTQSGRSDVTDDTRTRLPRLVAWELNHWRAKGHGAPRRPWWGEAVSSEGGWFREGHFSSPATLGQIIRDGGLKKTLRDQGQTPKSQPLPRFHSGCLPLSCCNLSPGRRAGVSGDRGDAATSLRSGGRAGGAAPGRGPGERMCTAARRAAPGGVAVTGATGAWAGSAAAALALQQGTSAAAAAEAAGRGEPGWVGVGAALSPLARRATWAGGPRIYTCGRR